MALIRIGFFSETLGMCTHCTVILPQMPTAEEPGRTFPVVTLLHNLTRNNSAWQRMTAIERYAISYGVAVVMPEAHLSSYADMLHGGKFFTYIADELPKIMRSFFPFSDKREDNFIAGCSMGGYGALKIALSRPENYAAVGSLSSGYTSYRGYISREDDRGLSLQYLTFGEDGLDREDAEMAEKARALARKGKNVPRVFISCGDADPLLLDNCREAKEFFGAFEGNPFDFVYEEHPGIHTWSYWDDHICDFFRYAGLKPHQCFF